MRWAHVIRQTHPEIQRIGLFGSYSNDNYTAASDLDVLIIVTESAESRWFMRQAVFNTLSLPLPVDLFVYTDAEASRMKETSAWFRHITHDMTWLD